MKKVNVKNIKAGKVVYYVHALGENSSISKYIVMGRPKPYRWSNLDREPSLFVPTRYVLRNNIIAANPSEFSLLDANVQRQNEYNSHRLFFKQKAAERYLLLCKHHNIDLVHDIDDLDSFWDYRYD